MAADKAAFSYLTMRTLKRHHSVVPLQDLSCPLH
jgi:hypothetical protein